MVAPAAFSIADIRDLATRADRFPREQVGGGFSFPQRSWTYRAAEAYYGGGREWDALQRSLDAALAGGVGATAWKKAQIADVRSALERMVALDGKTAAVYIGSLFRNPLEPVPWRGHVLRLPLGLLFADAAGRSMRLLAIERYLDLRRKGVTVIAAAALAAAETRVGELDRCELWHLRDGRISSYTTRDLRASWPRLDRLLSYGEERRSAPPAA